MKKMTVLIIITACLCLPMQSCGRTPIRYSVTYTDVFDTVTEITAYANNAETFDRAVEAAHEELIRLHRLFDVYNTYDGVEGLCALNHNCGKEEQFADPDIVELIKTGLRYGELSGGALNIASGAVLSLWHDCRERGEGLPEPSALSDAAEHIDQSGVVIGDGVMSFEDEALQLDAGAIAKGYAADKAAGVLRGYGITDFLINAGGNVVASGAKPDGEWTVGIQSPDGGIYTKVKVKDLSVVTSGDYQRYYEYEGKRYGHIIDLTTLYPAEYCRSVTVICTASVDADALSTALFCMEPEKGAALARSCGAEAMYIFDDGTCYKTEGFAAYE